MSRLTAALLVAVAMTGCSFDASSVPGSSGGTADAGAGVTAPAADPQRSCAFGCHGDADTGAPPRDNAGNEMTSERTVGAHRSHIKEASGRFLPVICTDCHKSPQDLNSPEHMDGDNVAELTFSDRATGNDTLQPAWDRNSATCTNVYCHGVTLAGGSQTVPSWTLVTGAPLACTTCHGYPPPTPAHTGETDCGTCHPTVERGAGATVFRDPASHINGEIDVNQAQADNCVDCHGEGMQPAPPLALDRPGMPRTGRDLRGVGAHREHLDPSAWHRAVACAECHKFPSSVNEPGHMDDNDLRAEVIFDDFLNRDAVYDNATGVCSNVFCHGDAYSTNGSETWTNDLQLGCGSCHDDGTANGARRLSGEHKRHIDEQVPCFDCHSTVLIRDQKFEALEISSIGNADLHVNLFTDVAFVVPTNWNPQMDLCSSACHPVSSRVYPWRSGRSDDDD